MDDKYNVILKGKRKELFFFEVPKNEIVRMVLSFCNRAKDFVFQGNVVDWKTFGVPQIYSIIPDKLNTVGRESNTAKQWEAFQAANSHGLLEALQKEGYYEKVEFVSALGSNVTDGFIHGNYGSKKFGPLMKGFIPEKKVVTTSKKSNQSQSIGLESKKSHAMEKIFVSHAFKDKHLVDLFVHQFLRLGLEVPSKDIFCTSLAGMGIPSGDDFRIAIKDRLQNAELVFLIITPNYHESQMCLAEMGAAWVLGKRVIPIIVPPIDYAKAGILVTPNQIMKLDDSNNLDQLKTDIESALRMQGKVHLAAWGATKGAFLKAVEALLRKNRNGKK